MTVELEQEQLTALIDHLGALTARYEAEAACLAKLSESERAHSLALERLEQAQDALTLWERLVHI